MAAPNLGRLGPPGEDFPVLGGGGISFFGRQAFVGEEMRRRLGGRLKELVRYRVIITEDVSPSLQAMRATMDREWPLIGKMIADIIEENIRKAYYTGPVRWPELATSTILRKIREGTPYGLGPRAELQWWLTLRGDVEDRLRVYVVRTRLGMQIVLDPRSFENAPYVAVHELGLNPHVPQRSFVADGIEDSRDQIDNLMRAWIAVKRDMLRKPKKYGIPPQRFESDVGRVKASLLPGFGFWAWLLVPPNQLLRYVALAGDIRSVFKGTWTSRSSETFVRNYMLGQYGLTRKAVRRRIRYRVWGSII